MLRIVTILIGSEVAAVDMGGIFNNTYTLFAGATKKSYNLNDKINSPVRVESQSQLVT